MADDQIPRITISKKDLLARFDNLRNLKPSMKNLVYKIRNLPPDIELTLEGKSWILSIPGDEYKKYNFISHNWIDHLIIKVRVGGNISPAQYWWENSSKIRDQAQEQFGQTDDNSLRQVIYDQAVEATAFRPSTAASIYRLFKAQKILDFSSGWGDRLIGAMACDVELYVGVDPNPDLVPCYKAMIDFFSEHRSLKGQYVMCQAPFEKWDSDHKDFDLVFTSPPYFNFEIYNTEDPNQSVAGRNLQKWFSEFLMPSLVKALSLLKPDGILALNINDIYRGGRYVMAMLAHTELIGKYLGCVSYAGFDDKGQPKNPQPIWIFSKAEPNQPKFARWKNSLKK